MDAKLLTIKDLKIVYESNEEIVNAVNGISLDLKKGEAIGIVGETGAGKTTTALSILGLLPEKVSKVEQGEIVFDGKDLLKVPERELRDLYRGERISMIFQDPMTSLNPILKIGDQISEALIYHNKEKKSKDEIEDRVDEVLELVGIPKTRKNEYPHQFSGGMKQRVVIAIALACEPELLIADEPTTALDVTIQAQVLNMIGELRNKLNTSLIMITHDFGVVAQVCDKVAVMYSGELVEKGTVEDIFDEEKNHHPYTIGLFGSIPNLKEEVKRLSPIEGLIPDPTDLPSGCFFSPRCKFAMDICYKEHPISAVSGEHEIACHLYNGRIKEATDEK
ncbi:MAG: ABC transporter ATP-binding protein [Synergistaceae bacterium]|nr:ABC transporter ATP-binding protein [Synergistaceae bacterium]